MVQRVVTGDPAGDHAGVDLSRVRADQGDLDAGPRVGSQIADDIEVGVAGTGEQEAFHGGLSISWLKAARRLRSTSVRFRVEVGERFEYISWVL